LAGRQSVAWLVTPVRRGVVCGYRQSIDVFFPGHDAFDVLCNPERPKRFL
jgi:hypothetical protein